MELLKEKGLLPDFASTATAQVLVGATKRSLYSRAVSTACLLRSEGLSVELVLQEKRLKALLQKADRIQSGEGILPESSCIVIYLPQVW